MTGICTSSTLTLLARLNDMEAKASERTPTMNPADGYTQAPASDFDVTGKHPLPTAVDVTQPVCQQQAIKTPSSLDFIMAYESGEITDEQEVINGFQQLIDSGLVWRLQGGYGRTAASLIEAGYCHA